jgi:hypothetical protein
MTGFEGDLFGGKREQCNNYDGKKVGWLCMMIWTAVGRKNLV